MLEFFIAQELYGLFSIAIASSGFYLLCCRTVKLARFHGASNIFSLLKLSLNPAAARLTALLLFCLLTGSSALMAAAIKTALLLYDPSKANLLTTLMILLTALITLRGRHAFVRCTAIIAPMLLGCLILCSLYSLYLHLFLWQDGRQLLPLTAPPWSACFYAGLIYCFYNSAALITALIPLSAETDNCRACHLGLRAGILVFLLVAACIFITLLLHRPAAYSWPLPMLTISATQFPFIFCLYTASFITAAWSSFLSSFYNMKLYLQSELHLTPALSLILPILSSLLLSQFEFSQLLNLLAPFISLSGLLIGLLLL